MRLGEETNLENHPGRAEKDYTANAVP